MPALFALSHAKHTQANLPGAPSPPADYAHPCTCSPPPSCTRLLVHGLQLARVGLHQLLQLLFRVLLQLVHLHVRQTQA